MDFLKEMRYNNPFNHIIVILDIELIFIAPYPPQWNLIEIIWKSIKRVVSTIFFKNQDEFIEKVKISFVQFAKDKSFCRAWMAEFVKEEVQ